MRATGSGLALAIALNAQIFPHFLPTAVIVKFFPTERRIFSILVFQLGREQCARRTQSPRLCSSLRAEESGADDHTVSNAFFRTPTKSVRKDDVYHFYRSECGQTLARMQKASSRLDALLSRCC